MKRIFSILSFLLAVLQITADDTYVKMTSLDEIDTEGTYLMASADYIGKAFSGNFISTMGKNSWFNSSKTTLTIPDSYSSSGLFFVRLVALNTNNTFAFKIKESGKYLNNPSSNYLNQVDNYSNKRAQWIIEKSSEGLNVKSNYNTAYYIKKKNTNDLCCTNSTTSTYKKVILYKRLPATETITIGNAGYATYVPSYSLDFTTQTAITSFIVTHSTNTAAILESMETIPAKTPIVVSGTPGAYPIPVIASSDAVTGNLLNASDGTVRGDGKTIYALSNLSDGVGFYLVDTNVAIPAGRCYLRIQESSTSPLYMHMRFGHTTGIEEKIQISDDPYFYTLSGQRVVHPRRGLYLYKGKKIMIR